MKDKLRLLAEQTGNPELGTFSLDDLTEDAVEEVEDNVLVYSEEDYHKIYILDGERSVEIAERDIWVRSLVSHDGKLYDCGDNRKIYETLTGKVIAERDNYLYSLVSHDGKLYDCGEDGLYETFTGEKIVEGGIRAMASVPRRIFAEAGIL